MRQWHLEQVSLDDGDIGMREAAPQSQHKRGVTLHRHDVSACPGDRRGQRAVAGTQIENEITRTHTATTDQLAR